MSRTLVTRKPGPSATGSPHGRYCRCNGARQIRLLLVDNHEIARVGVRTMLDHAEHIKIIGEAGTVAAGIENAHRLRPDVVLIELRLPDGKGIDVLRRMHEVFPDTCLLVLTHSSDDRSIISALRSGAAGFLLKSITGSELVHAVETVAAGQSILHPDVSTVVMTYIRNQAASIYHNIQGRPDGRRETMETTIMSPQDNHTGEVCMVDQERWAEIRRLRHDEQISIAEIGWRLDVDHKTVRRCQVCFGPLGLRVPVSPGVLPVS